jgi:hypothetical protein
MLIKAKNKIEEIDFVGMKKMSDRNLRKTMKRHQAKYLPY